MKYFYVASLFLEISSQFLDLQIPQNYKGPLLNLFSKADIFKFSRQQKPSFFTNDDGTKVGSEIKYPTIISYMTIIPKSGQNFLDSDITIVTQTSLNRLSLLKDIAASWGGSISVSVYIESTKELPTLNENLDLFAEQMMMYNHTKITISLLFGAQFFIDGKFDRLLFHQYDFLYPINALRNLALKAATTEFVVSLDIDFLPSKDALAYLTSPIIYPRMQSMTENSFVAFAFAAFELLTPTGLKIPFDRAQLDFMCKKMKVVPFHSYITIEESKIQNYKVNRWCEGKLNEYHIKITKIQGLTDFPKWLTATEMYPIADSNKIERYYEPYYVAKREDIPPFDERFRGYSFNKRQHNIKLQYLGFKFIVLPKVFVIHRWHAPSISKKLLIGPIKGTVGRSYEKFLYEINQKSIQKKNRQKLRELLFLNENGFLN